MTSSPSAASMTVVSGPTVQRSPIDVAPRRNVDGSMIVSAPIRTPTSIGVVSGSTIVTPARMCASRMRCWAIRRTRAELDAVVDAEQERRVVRS